LEFRDWFPSVDGFRFIAASIPPTTTAQPAIDDEAEVAAEVEEFAPGMHTTDTVDLIYVVFGEVIRQADVII
jgi:hypothetical protein